MCVLGDEFGTYPPDGARLYWIPGLDCFTYTLLSCCLLEEVLNAP